MTKDLIELSKRIRRNILELTFNAGSEGSHIGGALSASDILSVLYGRILKYDISNPQDPTRDRFILSKGHTAIALYSTLYECVFITKEDLLSFETDHSKFQTHCTMNVEKGIEISSGSLGWGLSVSIGMQIDANKKGLNYYNYVLLGNGECNEGSIWEAAMLASQLKLHRLIAVIDNNHMQLDGFSDNILNSRKFKERFEAFGWNVIEADGHNIDKLINAFMECKLCKDKPSIIIAETVKGKGISFLENSIQSHHMVLTEEQYVLGLKELGINYD